jgi:hypothetical protein
MNLFVSFRGQILPDNTLTNTEEVELIYEGFKYVIQVTKTGPSMYFLSMNDSHLEMDVHRSVSQYTKSL